jgi:cyclic peptide transporter
MFMYFTRRLGRLLALAVFSSSACALLALSLFGMISTAKAGFFAGFHPGIYAGVWGLMLATSIGASALLSRLSAQAAYQVRTSLIRRILGTPYAKLEQAGSPRLHNVLTADVANIANTFSELPTFVFNLILLVSCLGYLAFLSPRLFAVLAVAVGVSFIVSRTLIGRLARHSRAMREGQDAMMEAYKGMLDGGAQLAIDAARKSAYYERELQPAAQALQQHERRFRFLWDLNRGVTVALVFLLLGVLMEAGRRLGDQAVVMSYALIVTYCAGPFAMVVNLLQMFAHAGVSLCKIEALQIDAEAPMPPPAPPAPPKWSALRFSQVRFAYRQESGEEAFMLGPLDLELRKGEVVFITGGNGSGKSTFLKLLLGLHEPTAGELSVDGVRVGPPQQPAYRALFGVVLGDFHLFRQVLDAAGQPAAGADVERLLERFNLASVVKVRDGRFDTVKLSQGQRKRLALVAALAQDKDVYVLDEWAADQDPQYRRVFYEEIIPWLRDSGKTVVAVTHDDRYFHVADRRIAFETGRIRSDDEPGPQPPRAASRARQDASGVSA